MTVAPLLAVGWVGPAHRIDRHAWRAESGDGVHVWQYGHVFRERPQRARLAATDTLCDYMAAGATAIHEYEGSFVVVVADLRCQKVYVVPDRLCTNQTYFTTRGDSVVIGPEVKSLCAAFGVTPDLCKDAVVGFLAAGYNIGAQTLFTDVHQLEMGRMLEVGMQQPRGLQTRRFWKLDFSSADKFKKRSDAEDALFESIKDSHRTLLTDGPQFQILLSGGADSRGMLGVCSLLGLPPARAVSFGSAMETPRSDASISRSLAERFGVPWSFIDAGTDTFVDHCEQWAYISELANDNFGWYGEGFGTLRRLQDGGPSCSFIGDESWGWHGFAYDEFDAHSKVLPPGVPEPVLMLLPEHRREAAALSYQRNIAEAMRDCSDTDWTDRKDYCYLHTRVARFILSLGYGRGHALEQRRPFLTRAVLDVVRRMPTEYRVHKNAYQTMLGRHLPETAKVPVASVSSLPDWNYDLRVNPRLRVCFGSLLSDAAVEFLGDTINLPRLAELRDAFFAEHPTPVVRKVQPSKLLEQYAKQLVWQHSLYKHVDRWKKSRAEPSRRVSIAAESVLRRVALLVLLDRQRVRFATA